MTRKGRKSLTLWKECEICGSVINAKDTDIHGNSCPPDENNWNHNYIKKKTLYSTFEDIDVRVVPSWMRHELMEEVIFLSQSAMQICEFVIGFPVIINISDKQTIKRVWPTPEGSLTSVMLSKDALEIDFNCNLCSNMIKVSKLNVSQYVNIVRYTITNIEDEIINFVELSKIISNRFKDKYFFIGNRFRIPFYGKKILIQIVQTKGHIHGIEDLKVMTLNETVYTSDENTQFECANQRRNVLSHDVTVEPQIIKFGGYESIINEIKQNMTNVLDLEENMAGDPHCIGILIYGINGIGKTLITKYLVNLFNVNIVNIQGMEIFSKYYGETEGKLRALFENAIKNAPSIITLDNIEVLCSKKGSDQERRIISTLLSLFDGIKNKNIVVLATTSNPDKIDPALRRVGRLEVEIEIPVPNVSDREAILNSHLQDINLKETIKKISEISHGFVGADLASVIVKARTKAILANNKISKEDLIWAHSQVMPSAMREVFVQIPNVKWSDIAGQEGLKLKLQQCVEWPLKYTESFKRLGIKAPSGVLLFGPPGCSKTMIAKAIATESQLNFLSVKGTDIFSKWVGESERAVRDIFKRARCVAPSIIFIDEVDALGGERDNEKTTGGSAVQERVLSQLLTEMDGVLPLDNVVVIAATNRPDRIDKALLRPGRLDRLIYVPLPDSDTRTKLFHLKFQNMPTDQHINLEELTQLTESYSGAEIVAVCNEAALLALEENIHATCIKMDHFRLAAREKVLPRTSKTLLKIYKDYFQ